MHYPLFKISASLVKPTRESLLDYCSYCLFVIGLIGIARVWIGGTGLRNGCVAEDFEFPGEQPPLIRHPNEPNSIEESVKLSTESLLRPTKETKKEVTTVLVQVHNDFYQRVTGVLDTLESRKQIALRKNVAGRIGYFPEVNDGLRGVNASVELRQKCAKQYQSVFAYVLLIESAILLFVGLLWAKVPKVSFVINEFTKLIHSCEKSEWAKRALRLIRDKGQVENMSQSLYSVISSDSAIYDIKSLLDTIFHPDGDYATKACARHLYEKVQIFCDIHTRKTGVWRTYVIKSFLQFGLWLTIFNINLVLFVLLEFYIMCPEDNTIPCDHDTFLRIVWFLAQTVLLIYVVFICKTLRWINEKSVFHLWSCCSHFSCIKKHRTLYTNEENHSLTCRPYRFAANEPVYNDVALLLHLLEEAHPEVLPYFVVFMFPEWKEKLTSFANPVRIGDKPARSAMQMLSGRPPPIIEITDIPTPSETEEQEERGAIIPPSVPKKKSKNAVTFYIGKENEAKNNRSNKSSDDALARKTNGLSQVEPSHVLLHQKDNGQSLSSSKVDDKISPWHRVNPDTERASPRCSKLDEKISPWPRVKFGTECASDIAGEDAGETAALVHRTSSLESVQNSEHDSSVIEAGSNHSSDTSESRLLLRNS